MLRNFVCENVGQKSFDERLYQYKDPLLNRTGIYNPQNDKSTLVQRLIDVWYSMKNRLFA